MMKQTSRRYLKRVWRVPKHRGAPEYLATLIVKALRKHGWPAYWEQPTAYPWTINIKYKDAGPWPPVDFQQAVSIACRIVAKAYRVDVTETEGSVTFNRPYYVTNGGHFKESKDNE